MSERGNATARRRIYLMRHGSVTYFDASGKPHLPESVPLNEPGRLQARAAGAVFSQLGLVFDRVITSGLPRTVETAAHVLAETKQAIDIERWPELEEIRGGRLSTIPDASLRDAFVGAFEGMVREERRFLGGESIGELLDRVLPALTKLRADASWNTVLLVLHGGVNRAILSHALTAHALTAHASTGHVSGGHGSNGPRFFLGNLSQAPGCINALDVGSDPADWIVRMTNYAASDLLQPLVRETTMETLYAQYLRFRKTA
jgi:probable phosphoglycerate mutase